MEVSDFRPEHPAAHRSAPPAGAGNRSFASLRVADPEGWADTASAALVRAQGRGWLRRL